MSRKGEVVRVTGRQGQGSARTDPYIQSFKPTSKSNPAKNGEEQQGQLPVCAGNFRSSLLLCCGDISVHQHG
ncbi:MAG: hypothetical protein AB8F78_11945 [Saprospiraceae bacterium]